MYFNNWLHRAIAIAVVLTLVTACGGGSGGSAPTIDSIVPGLNTPPSSPAGNNVLRVTVDAGPTGTGYNVNRLYTDVTICLPGSISQCQTISHVLVDTGSTGLRLLASAISPAMKLSRLSGTAGLPLLNCAQFVDNTFAWGPVAGADIVLGGKKASAVPIQIVGDPAFARLGAVCSSGTGLNTMATLGANGIIGLGLFKEDCGSRCVGVAGNGFYYTCSDTSCTATTPSRASLSQQLKNPVALFGTDNNGVLIDLPAVDLAGAASLNGWLMFGVGTQPNNQLTSGRVLTTGGAGHLTTMFSGKTLNNSFIDTGSNGLYFDSDTIALCGATAAGFYCPAARTTLSAESVGANAARVPISFSIDNALTLFASYPNAVLATLSGSIGDPNVFDWGLPFFYGRRVFIGIEGQASPLGTGPFYAF